MRTGRRTGWRKIRLASGAVVVGMLARGGGGGAGGDGSLALGADRTFNVSLVGSLNPLTTGPGTTNNFYADLEGEGNVVALGSVGASSGVAIINNTNPAAPTLYSRYMPAGTENGQFRDVI